MVSYTLKNGARSAASIFISQNLCVNNMALKKKMKLLQKKDVVTRENRYILFEKSTLLLHLIIYNVLAKRSKLSQSGDTP